MLIIPAIDLLYGKVVRLTQGDYGKVKTYSDDPVEMARIWKDKGAGYLHIVDLDGAKEGRPVNLEAVKGIIESVDVEVELGGGIRSFESIEEVLALGVSRVILGTSVFKDKDFAKSCISRFGKKVIFSVDARGKTIVSDGWTKDTGTDLYASIKYFESAGLKRIIYTDILKDGMMKGPNFESLKEILEVTNMEVIASGGISTIDDVKKLKALEKNGLTGAIIGKALYEGTIKLEEVLNVD